MNVASASVLAAVLALAALAAWRVRRRGAPCSCGCSGGCPGTGCGGCARGR